MSAVKEIQTVAPQELRTIQPTSALSPMVQAVMNGQMTPEQLQSLLNVQKDYERNEAEKAFHQALADFKKNEIKMDRDKLVSYKTDKGTTEYRHTTLGSALIKINPILSQYGLSLTWETAQGQGGMITVSCVLSHSMGFSKTTSLSASPDQSGGKNNIQAIGSTVSYLQRYTAFALLGLASVDQDDDGKSGGDQTITEEQAMTLQALIEEVKADKAGFLKFMDVTRLDEIGAKHYTRAVKALEKKRSAK